MDISDKVKNFLEDPRIQQLINNNNWGEIYKLVEQFLINYRGNFTQLMLSAGIDPLRYLDYIPDFYLQGTNITNFKIPNHIKSIGFGAFSYCEKLTNIVIPEKITIIESNVFDGCLSLKSAIIPDNVVELNPMTFHDCYALESLTLGKSVSKIGHTFMSSRIIESINYNNTMKNWKKISGIQGKNRDEIVNNPTLFHCKIICIDGDLKFDSRVLEWVEI